MNYGDIPKKYSNRQDSKIVVLPVPYDATSTWVKGADKGPKAIIEASANMELYDTETDSEVYKHGIFTDKPVNADLTPPKIIASVEGGVLENIKKGKFTVVIGGEHSVSIGAIQACSKKYKDMCVLQLDAHSDLREEYNGSRYNHACVMARIKEICPIVQVGIRSMDYSELKSAERKRIFFAEDIQKDHQWVKKVTGLLSDKVYITLDLDVLDPSIMPSTGTPEPGGLLWYDILGLLKEVTKKKELIGFDVVELCPNPNNKSPDFLASKLIYKILSYKFGGIKNE